MTSTDRDILISRVIDGEATPEDWTALRVLAARDIDVWRDLAESQQDHDTLSRDVDTALAAAERVELPISEHYSERLSERLRVVVTWAGWAVAAALGLAFVRGPIELPDGGLEPQNVAGIANMHRVETPNDALDLYLDKGHSEGLVIAEMPTKVLLESRPNPAGEGYEVLYYRQILERAIVPSMYSLEERGIGRAVTRPATTTDDDI